MALDFATDATFSVRSGEENGTRRKRAVSSEARFDYKELWKGEKKSGTTR
jgi:hypothetical protein